VSNVQSGAGNLGAQGSTQSEKPTDLERREALLRLAAYTAPAMVALLTSTEEAGALACVSPCPPSDIRLKRDIAMLGEHADGINLYRFRYLWSDTMHVGVMAQEVAAARPDAVRQGADGYLRVDYTRLGLRMRTWVEWAGVGQVPAEVVDGVALDDRS
jgi:hypothetical protein